MDRQIVYPGQILPETSLLQMAKDAMIGVAKLSAAVLGTSTMANGFAVTPTGPASLQVVCAPGEIYSLTSIDALAFSTLPADTTHSIMKQGILLDGVTLSCPAPGTTGQSINYLIQVTYQDSDSTPVLLPYYNSANPALPYSGMGNNGLTQNTSRKGVAVVAVKAGASAATGSQVTPAPDAGYVGLYVVAVAFGQTTITAGSITQYSAAPLLPAGLLQSMQSGLTLSANDVGAANAYAANFTPAITALTDKMRVCIKVSNPNTAASTFTPAPGVIAPSPIVGAGHAALQGGEMVTAGDAWLQWNSSVGAGSWVLTDATGGGAQIAPATQSRHAVQLSQAQDLAASSAARGAYKNLRASTTGLSAIVLVSFEEIVLKDSTGKAFLVSNFAGQLSLATTGLNGVDTGTSAASTWYSIWAVTNGVTPGLVAAAIPTLSGNTTLGSGVITGMANTSSLRVGMPAQGVNFPVGAFVKSVDSPSQVTLNVPANLTQTGAILRFQYDPVMPSGYTAKARVCSVRTDGTANKFPLGMTQNNDTYKVELNAGNTTNTPVIAAGALGNIAGTPAGWSAVSLIDFIPPTAYELHAFAGMSIGTGTAIVAPSALFGGVGSAVSTPFTASGGASSPNSGIIREALERPVAYYASNLANATFNQLGYKDAN